MKKSPEQRIVLCEEYSDEKCSERSQVKNVPSEEISDEESTLWEKITCGKFSGEEILQQRICQWRFYQIDNLFYVKNVLREERWTFHAKILEEFSGEQFSGEEYSSKKKILLIL
jgi:hypothetical protein